MIVRYTRKRRLLSGSELFNASTSIITLPTHTAQTPLAQSMIALVNIAGAGALTTNTVINNQDPGLTNVGFRMRFADNAGANGSVQFNGCSATLQQPVRGQTVGGFPYNVWTWAAATWDGSITAANIHLYQAALRAAFAETTYALTTDGTGSPNGGAGVMSIGARFDATRNFNGSIALIARWNRVLSTGELEQAKNAGPLAVPAGLIFCWAYGRDYGPYRIVRMSQTAIGQGLAAPYVQLGMRTTLPPWIQSGARHVRPPQVLLQANNRANL